MIGKPPLCCCGCMRWLEATLRSRLPLAPAPALSHAPTPGPCPAPAPAPPSPTPAARLPPEPSRVHAQGRGRRHPLSPAVWQPRCRVVSSPVVQPRPASQYLLALAEPEWRGYFVRRHCLGLE